MESSLKCNSSKDKEKGVDFSTPKKSLTFWGHYTLQDKSKGNFAEKFIQNELNVLLTRGVNGLYIYAVDSELRNALLKAQKNVPY